MLDLDGMLADLERNLETVLKALEGAKAEMDSAVAAEREACAKIVDQLGCCGEQTARKIRARGDVKKEEEMKQPYSKVTLVSNAQMDTLIELSGDVEGQPEYLAEDGRTWPKRPPVPDSITTSSFEVRWMGDSLTESPGAQAILASMPPGFQTTDELDAFYAGDQWKPAVKAKRDSDGRRSLTLNMLPRLVALAMEKHLATPGGLRLTNEDCHFVRAYITARNRDAQMAFNYMASAALEASAPKDGGARLINPHLAGRELWIALGQDPKRWPNCGEDRQEEYRRAAMSFIDFYLKQPKV